MRILRGEQSPDFAARDIRDRPLSLYALRHSKVLLAFYPDMQGVDCSLRLLALRSLVGNPLEIIVVSADSASRVCAKFPTPPPGIWIVADPERRIFDAYSVEPQWWGLRSVLRMQALREDTPGANRQYERCYPADFLIDPGLVVHTAYYADDPHVHLGFDTITRFAAATHA